MWGTVSELDQLRHSLCEERDRALNGSDLRFDVLVPHCDVSEQRNPPHKSVSGVVGSRKSVLLRWLLLLVLLVLLPMFCWSLRLLIALQQQAVDASLMGLMSVMSAIST